MADLTEQYGVCNNSTLEVRTAKTESKPYTGIRIKNDLEEAYEVCAVSGGGEPFSTTFGTKTVKAWPAPMSDSAVTNISVSKL